MLTACVRLFHVSNEWSVSLESYFVFIFSLSNSTPITLNIGGRYCAVLVSSHSLFIGYVFVAVLFEIYVGSILKEECRLWDGVGRWADFFHIYLVFLSRLWIVSSCGFDSIVYGSRSYGDNRPCVWPLPSPPPPRPGFDLFPPCYWFAKCWTPFTVDITVCVVTGRV